MAARKQTPRPSSAPIKTVASVLGELNYSIIENSSAIVLYTNDFGGRTIAKIDYSHIPKEQGEAYAESIVRAVNNYDAMKIELLKTK